MQQQTLQQLVGGVKAKAYEAEKAEENQEATFFDRMLPKLRSGELHAKYEQAKKIGEQRADAFMETVRSPVHRSHDVNVESYYKNYGGDYNRLRNSFIDAAAVELGAIDPEDAKRDLAYEDRMAKHYRPQGNISLDDVAFYNVLQANLKKSRDANGYGKDKCFDNAVIADWKAKYRR